MFETIATQSRERAHTGLAGIDSAKLKKLRSSQLRECFNLIDEMRHKLEFVARIRGISFVDDTASRTPLSTWYALETVDGPIVWIANGREADSTTEAALRRLHSLVEAKVSMIVCIGSNECYANAFGDVVKDIVSVDSIAEAVHTAFYSNMESGKILFSPAVENGVSYESQGDSFKNEVNEL